ncbi:hypothetical protein L195_g000994 [Trifolium pratense]|uniref:Uncharacterized protein n=1 Tax=Trifolium pratense TaxID=57577 RepID=A0A2K3NNH2_TRIPR|nr:hypothetical protein L195_g000994 [Trifolium pratense]
MNGDQARPDEGMQLVRVDTSWVANETRETPSIFSGCTNGHKELYFEVEDIDVSNWEIRVPIHGRRICSNWGWGTIPVYQIIFEHMGYRMPFTDLEQAVFRHMRVTPSQLHPNLMAFLRVFEALRRSSQFKCGVRFYVLDCTYLANDNEKSHDEQLMLIIPVDGRYDASSVLTIVGC